MYGKQQCVVHGYLAQVISHAEKQKKQMDD